MTLDLNGRLIDNNFYRLRLTEASKLAKESLTGRLPRQGYEIRVNVNGCPCWLTRTFVNGEQVWAVHSPLLYNHLGGRNEKNN